MPGGNRNGARESAAALLALGRTARQTAHECEVSERTVFNWLKEGAFAARVKELRERAIGEATGALKAACQKAVGALVDLLDSQRDLVRLGAAKVILEQAIRLRESEELAARVEQLERLLAAKEAR